MLAEIMVYVLYTMSQFVLVQSETKSNRYRLFLLQRENSCFFTFLERKEYKYQVKLKGKEINWTNQNRTENSEGKLANWSNKQVIFFKVPKNVSIAENNLVYHCTHWPVSKIGKGLRVIELAKERILLLYE